MEETTPATERCKKHDLLPGQCADCRGLGEVADPYEGVVILHRYDMAQYRARCWLFPEDHVIHVGSQFARAGMEETQPDGNMGYICNRCTRKIDSRA